VDDKDSMFFVDSGVTYDGTATTTVTGLWHQRGETISVCADAGVIPDIEVSATGVATLDEEASLIQFGWQFISKLKSLPPEGGNPYGSAQGKIKRLTHTTVRFLESLAVEYSVDGDNWTESPFRDTDDDTNESPPLFTGDKEFELDGEFESEGSYYIRQAKPYPSTILALMPKYVVTGV
jgi:hypothetical protein